MDIGTNKGHLKSYLSRVRDYRGDPGKHNWKDSQSQIRRCREVECSIAHTVVQSRRNTELNGKGGYWQAPQTQPPCRCVN